MARNKNAAPVNINQGKNNVDNNPWTKVVLGEGEGAAKIIGDYQKDNPQKDSDPKIEPKLETSPDKEDNYVAKELVALSLDRTASAEEMAYSVAQRELREELTNSRGVTGFIKRAWKGNLFRGYYVEKKRKEALAEIRDAQAESADTTDGWVSNCSATMQRFLSDYDGMIHEEAGESKNVVTDKKALEAAHQAIREFAKNQAKNGKEADAKFEEKMRQIENEMLGDGEEPDNKNEAVTLHNYTEMAEAIRGNIEHGISVDQMLEGFKWIQGEARTGVRTLANRSKIEEATKEYGKIGVSRFIPTELVAGAASVALQLSRKTASLAGFGIVVASASAAHKEAQRVQTDYTERMRDMASGLEVSDRTNYDKKLNEALVRMDSAHSLTMSIESALALPEDNPKRASELRRALATADARVHRSDIGNLDVISYSDPSKIEEERFALDLARAKARAIIGDKSRSYQAAFERADNDYMAEHRENEIDRSKKALDKLKIQRALTAGAVTGVSMLVSAKLTNFAIGKIKEFFADGAEKMVISNEYLTEQQVAEYEQEGKIVEKLGVTRRTTESTIDRRIETYSAKEYSEEFGTNIRRLGWAERGGNIQTVYNEAGNGLSFKADGITEATNGAKIDISEQIGDNKVFAYISLSQDTQMAPIKIPGVISPDGTIEFIPEEGSVASTLFENGKFIGKYAEIAVESGVSEDGVESIIPLATVVGEGVTDGLSEMVAETTEEIVEEVPIYKVITPGISVEDGMPLPSWMPIGGYNRSEMSSSNRRNVQRRDRDEEIASNHRAIQNVIDLEQKEAAEATARAAAARGEQATPDAAANGDLLALSGESSQGVIETASEEVRDFIWQNFSSLNEYQVRGLLGDFGYELLTSNSLQDPVEIWNWYISLSDTDKVNVREKIPLDQIQNENLRELLTKMNI